MGWGGERWVRRGRLPFIVIAQWGWGLGAAPAYGGLIWEQGGCSRRLAPERAGKEFRHFVNRLEPVWYKMGLESGRPGF